MKNILILFSIILISGIYFSSVYAFETDQKSYISSKYNPAEIKITGVIDNYQIGKRYYVELITPDNLSEEYDVRVTNKGDFSLIIKAEPDWLVGTYTIIANYDGTEITKNSFEIKSPDDFRTSIVTKPVTEPKKEIIQTVSTQKPSTIPDWVKNIALWYGQGTVSEDDFINAIQFLADKGIIKLKGNSDSPVQSTSQPKTISPEPKPIPPKPTTPPVTVTTPTKTTDPSIMTNIEFEKVFSNPDNYKGKWAKLTGEISQIMRESDGTAYVFDTSANSFFDLTKQIWLITQKTNLNLKEDSCYVVEGKIIGGNEAELLFTGAKRNIPTIQLEKYNEISCLDAKYPVIKSIKVDQTQTKGNMKVTVKTIDITNAHTRIFVEVENLGNPDSFSFSSYSAIIIQDKRQFKYDYAFGVDYDDIESEIPTNVIEDGYIILDPIQPKSFQLILEGTEWSDNAHQTDYGVYSGYLDHKFEFNITIK